jgi:hypothetical protein
VEDSHQLSAGALNEPKIIDCGRGPEVAGSRITVFDVRDDLQEGGPTREIARLFHLGTDQADVASRSVEEHG